MSEDNGVWVDPKAARTLPQLIRAAAAAYGDGVAVRLEADAGPEEITFRELERRSAELGRALLARGIGKGARVGFIAGNGPQFATWLFAIARIGAVAIPISTMIRANELVRVLRQSDVCGLFVQRQFLGYDYAERLCEALPALRQGGPELRLPEAPYLRWIVSSGEGLPASFRTADWFGKAAETIGDELLRSVESEVHTTDQLIEIYTSGSMALPKGVRHNHGPVLFRTHYLRGMLGPAEPGADVNCYLPMFWVGGLMMYLLPGIEGGGKVLCTERTLSNSRVAMGSVLADEDVALMKNNKPYWGLGMSESLGPYGYGDELRAPGRPLCAPMDHFAPDYEIRIADEDDRPVGDGEVGEMQLRGYPVTPGLHKIERAELFTPDGYYKTGDMCLIEGQRIHFIGRNGDMIKTAGSNVSPAEVEMEMQQLESVHSAYVVGLPDKERGQLVAAAVVAREGATLDFAEVEAQLRQRLSGYKVPRAYLEIAREEVPLLHSNKVARREVARMIAERLGRVAA